MTQLYSKHTCLPPDDGRLISGSVPFCNRNTSLLLSMFMMATISVGNGLEQLKQTKCSMTHYVACFSITFAHDQRSLLEYYYITSCFLVNKILNRGPEETTTKKKKRSTTCCILCYHWTLAVGNCLTRREEQKKGVMWEG